VISHFYFAFLFIALPLQPFATGQTGQIKLLTVVVEANRDGNHGIPCDDQRVAE
jgi:hypothetical protein